MSMRRLTDNQPPGMTGKSPAFISSHFWHPAEQSEPATKDGEKCSSRSTKFMTSITEAVLDHCLAWF